MARLGARRILEHPAVFAAAFLTLVPPFPSRALAGPAVGQFEMKEVETEKGELEFQSQNAISWGMPRREVAETEPGELVYDGNTLIEQRYALELEYSWSDRFRSRAGLEFEKERVDDPDSFGDRNAFEPLELTEVAGEAVLVLVPLREDRPGLAWLAEYELALDRDEADTLTYGPLFEYETGAWEALANLYLVSFFGGERVEPGGKRDAKIDFAYAVRLLREISPASAVAIEAYGTIDRLGSSGTRSEESSRFGDHDQHRVGPVLYHTLDVGRTSATFGVGGFAGLNGETPDTTLKLSLEIEL